MKEIQKNRAQLAYEAAAEALLKFTEISTDMGAEILTEKYPFSVHFTPNEQITMFDTEGELNDLTVTVGISTSVRSNLKFKMDAGLLKKLIRLSEKSRIAVLHSVQRGCRGINDYRKYHFEATKIYAEFNINLLKIR